MKQPHPSCSPERLTAGSSSTRYAGEPEVDTTPLKSDETAKEELRKDASGHVAEVMWPFPYRLDLSGLLKAQSPATSAKIALLALPLPVPRSVAAETDAQQCHQICLHGSELLVSQIGPKKKKTKKIHRGCQYGQLRELGETGTRL
ncbi:hypothetical protein B0T13DRAFT_221082 [Neurospora crassa]|nr:hypothetical protein B0T13DRAFT_221082 [Neurospora crassa]